MRLLMGTREQIFGLVSILVLTGGVLTGGALAQGPLAATPADVDARGALKTVAYGQGTSAAVQDDLFAGTERFAKGASNVTEVSMDPETLGMVNGKDASRAHNMVLNVVRTYEYDKPGMYRIEDVEEFRNKLNTGDWHCSVHTRDLKHGESTDICSKHRTDGLLEQAIITVEPKELTFIHTIRKPSGGGAVLSAPDLGVVGGQIGPEMAMLGPEIAALRPALNAEIQMAMAEMHAYRGGLERDAHGNSLKIDIPRIEVPKIEVPKIEVPKINIPRIDLSKTELPKIDAQEIGRQMKELERELDQK